MPPRLSKNQLLAKKREAEKLRQIKIKSNPDALAIEKIKRHEKYLNRLKKKQVKPIAEMTSREIRKKRKQWRLNTSNHRAAKQSMLTLDNDGPQQKEQCVNQDGRIQSGKKKRIVYRVAMKRVVANLKLARETAEKSASKYRQKYYRLLGSSKQPSQQSTPRSKVKMQLRGRQIDPDIRKKLIFGEVMKEQLAQNFAQAKGSKSKQLFAQAVCGKVIKKYRCISQGKNFIKYRSYLKLQNQRTLTYIRKPNEKMKKVTEDIASYLSKDENTRLCPGKKDTLTKNKIKTQKRLLNMSLLDLHKGFLKGHSYKICYATFCRLRPFWVIDAKVVERDTCLCTTHANAKLLVQSLHRYNIVDGKTTSDLLSDLCCDRQGEDCLLRKCDACRPNCIIYKQFNAEQTVTYSKWVTIKQKRTDNHGKDITVQITKKDAIQCTVGDMVTEIEKIMPKFMVHTANISHQYSSMNELKSSLKPCEILFHIDFSENFCCKYSSEVQAVHFGASRQQVSLHTGILYHKDAPATSFCTSSDNLRHDPAAIWAHLRPIFELSMKRFENINTVHFLSDGPTTQYRNRLNFYLFGKYLQTCFPEITSASWNFTEAGHGKGAPDGVGATVKRTADRYIAHGNDISSYADLSKIMKEDCTGIFVQDVRKSDITMFETILADAEIKPFKGTMGVHQVFWSKESPEQLQFRNLSCFSCMSNVHCSHGYHMGNLVFDKKPEDENCDLDEPLAMEVEAEDHPPVGQPLTEFHLGDWIVVDYDNVHYPGVILSTLPDGIEVSCMALTSNGSAYKWPRVSDILIYPFDKIVKKVLPPVSCGKRAGQFTFPSM